jgi:hypothetical protein
MLPRCWRRKCNLRWKYEEKKGICELLKNYRFGDNLYEKLLNGPHD